MPNISGTLNLVIPYGIPSIFFAQGDVGGSDDRIGRTPLDGSVIHDFIVSGLGIPQDVAIDKRNNKLFFSDSGTGKIESIDFNGDNRLEIINTGTVSLRGIAVDHINQWLYWVDTGADVIKRSKLDGSNIETVYNAGGSSILQRITIDIDDGKIYWTDENFSNAKLMRANLDGSNAFIIANLGSSAGPRGIDIDFNNSKLYFANDRQDIVQRTNLDGSSLETIINIAAPQGVTIDQDNNHIYVGTNTGITRYDLDGSNSTSIISVGTPIRDIIFGIPDLEVIISGSMDLFIGAFDTTSSSVDLVIESVKDINANVELYVNGFDVINDNVDLYTAGVDQHNEILDLITFGSETLNATMDMFINGFDTTNSNLHLFIGGKSNTNNDLQLFTYSIGSLNSNAYLYILGPVAQSNNNIPLIVNGLEPKDCDTCPILDPSAFIQISDELIGIYQSRIDALINQIGKNIVLEFDPEIKDCPNCEFSILKKRSTGVYQVNGPIPFSRGRVCPYCKGRGQLIVPVRRCIKALIKWNPKDAVNYGISVSDHKNIVRFKTFTTDMPDLVRANYAISNYAIANVIEYKVKLIKQPILVGLRESRYAISFWTLMDF